jgi:hypothetical protein
VGEFLSARLTSSAGSAPRCNRHDSWQSAKARQATTLFRRSVWDREAPNSRFQLAPPLRGGFLASVGAAEPERWVHEAFFGKFSL